MGPNANDNVLLGTTAGASLGINGGNPQENVGIGTSRLGGNTPGNNCSGTVRIGSLGSGLAEKGTQNFAIAIGRNTGRTNQAISSIIISALGTDLDNTVANSCKIAPIRQLTTSLPVGNLIYNNTTKEVSFVDNAITHLSNPSVSGTTTIDAVQGLPMTVSQLVTNGLGLTLTDINLGGFNTVFFSNFVVGQTYLLYASYGMVHTTANQNRVCRIGQRFTTAALPVVADALQDSIMTTIFGQSAAIFSNCCWSNQLNGSVFTCTSSNDKIWLSSTVSVGVISLGGFASSPATITIRRI